MCQSCRQWPHNVVACSISTASTLSRTALHRKQAVTCELCACHTPPSLSQMHTQAHSWRKLLAPLHMHTNFVRLPLQKAQVPAGKPHADMLKKDGCKLDLVVVVDSVRAFQSPTLPFCFFGHELSTICEHCLGCRDRLMLKAPAHLSESGKPDWTAPAILQGRLEGSLAVHWRATSY